VHSRAAEILNTVGSPIKRGCGDRAVTVTNHTIARVELKVMSNDIALAKCVMLDRARHEKLHRLAGEDPAFAVRKSSETPRPMIISASQISVEVVCRDLRSDR
jgi:hypothetical protein